MAGHDKSIWFNELEPSSLNNGLASLFGLKPGAAFPTTNALTLPALFGAGPIPSQPSPNILDILIRSGALGLANSEGPCRNRSSWND